MENETDNVTISEKKIYEQNEIKQNFINNYLDFINENDLRNKIIKKINEFNNQDKAYFLKKLNLDENYLIENLEISIKNIIDDYKEYVDSLKEFFPEAKKKLLDWSANNNINYNQQINEVRVFVIDDILKNEESVSKKFNFKDLSSYDPVNNILFISTDTDYRLIIHEFLHALSYNKKSGNVGFSKLDNDLKYSNKESNFWLNEGCTVFIEKEIFNGKTHVGKKNIKKEFLNPYIDGYLWLTELFINKIGATRESLISAYFGDKNSLEILENLCMKKFKCKISDLNNLLIGYSQEYQQKIENILDGKEVYIDYYPGFDKNLLNIFPNIKLIDDNKS